jgi:hypothetical protein
MPTKKKSTSKKITKVTKKENGKSKKSSLKEAISDKGSKTIKLPDSVFGTPILEEFLKGSSNTRTNFVHLDEPRVLINLNSIASIEPVKSKKAGIDYKLYFMNGRKVYISSAEFEYIKEFLT